MFPNVFSNQLAIQSDSVLALILYAATAGLLVGLLRAFIDEREPPEKPWWKHISYTIASSIIVSTIVGLAIYDFEIGVKTKMAFTGICAYVASDILLGVRKISALVATDPLSFIRTIRELLAGTSKGKP